MGWKRILFGVWLIATLGLVNYAMLQEFLHPTDWENVFFDPWFWILSVGVPSFGLALLFKGVIWIVARIRHGKRRRRRRRHAHAHHHRTEHREPKLADQPPGNRSVEAPPPARRYEAARPKVMPRTRG